MSWERLAHVELSSAGDTIDSGTFTAKENLVVLYMLFLVARQMLDLDLTLIQIKTMQIKNKVMVVQMVAWWIKHQ